MNTHMIKHALATGVVSVGLAFVSAPAAQAEFGFVSAGAAVTGPDGHFSRQAGAHPDLRVYFEMARTLSVDGMGEVPDGSLRDVKVDLPVGAVGNPTVAPTCEFTDLVPPNDSVAHCPVAAQIGIAKISSSPNQPPDTIVGLYNIRRPVDAPALFAFNYAGAVVKIAPRVRPGDYGISADSIGLPQAVPTLTVDITLWGVPADSLHDAWRFTDDGHVRGTVSPDRRKPFLTSPTSCPDAPALFTISADPWENPGAFVSTSFDRDLDGTPFVTDGCERLPFDPSISVKPLSRTADAPTGLAVDLDVPQNDSPDSLATAHVKRVAVTLPEGMTVSPSSAAGLGACAPSEIKLGSNDDPTCPDSSKIGTVKVDTPLLDVPLEGDVILAQQDHNPFHSLLAMYIVAKGPGVMLKLPGKVDADEVTGRLTTTFDNNPQLPFSHLRLAFRGGSQAPLATPTACGTYTTHSEITSWASEVPVIRDSPMVIDAGCGPRDFAPTLSAGTLSPLAGADSPFSLTITRPDGGQNLLRIETGLPTGLLARIATVTQCAEDQAASGTCGEASQIGRTSVLSGPGAAPLALSGRVYLTGPYRDAPFGLSIVVPTAGQAGPFDLGNVVVRAGIYVDRRDAHVTVKSDPLPTILRGITLRLRQVTVTIDRPNFMFNPTSCAASSVFVSLGSLDGAARDLAAPFQVGGCGALDMKQKLALRFTGKTQLTDGKHPGISARLTAGDGGANLRKAVVKLPLSVALDPDNAQGLCKPEQRVALACPATSIVGHAKAVSILPHPLEGPVYFVEGVRMSKTGRAIRTLPKLWIPLSGDGVTIDIDASSAVDSTERLVTTFDQLPDAPISSFQLDITGGKHGIIVVSGKPGTCDRDRGIDSQFTGQNGKIVESTADAAVEGCKPKVTKSTVTRRSVTLRLSGLSAGRLSISGRGVKKAARTLNAATAASITASLSSRSRSALRRHRRVKVALTVRFQPKSGAASTVRKTVTIRR